jgi:ribonuclease III
MASFPPATLPDALSQDELRELGARLGADVPAELLLLALTHPSAVGEGLERTLRSNQRLEFLGDAILGAVVAEYLYLSDETLPEGTLTQHKAAAVRGRSLAAAAHRLELGRYVRLGRGEEAHGGRARDSILADVFEAVLAALFLSHGLNAARNFVRRALADELAAVIHHAVNAKNQLQEHTQAVGLGTPRYQTTVSGGPAHERRFTSQVLLLDRIRGHGSGTTKKEAECAAAAAALHELMAGVQSA